ncbi:sulfatase family protein [Halorientalis pallida]|uniref:sulfatase family protein n=1 Tax=Halorientalis pallida TaxID=2479928 RepID=UPI003C6ECE1F
MSDDTTKPNIILIIADTLRADILSCYGGEADTPTIDRLAEDGTIFEQAYAAGPWTPVSHAAMFSGQYPSETGVVDQTNVPEDIPLIATWLSEHGYDTFGIPGPSKMGAAYGFDRGFDEYFEVYTDDRPSHRSKEFYRKCLRDPTIGGPLIKNLVRRFRYGGDSHTYLKFKYLSSKIRRELERPFFGMLNTTLVHRPYDPPRPYKERAVPELQRSKWFLTERLLGLEETLELSDARVDHVLNAQGREGVARFLADPDYLTDAEFDVLKKWYVAGMEYLDTQVEQLLSSLERSGELENTIVIFTSDHGEHFGEKDQIDHLPYRLFEEVLRVPLVMNGPGIPSDRRRDLVSLVDIFDTLCDVSSIPAPEETSGRSVFGGESRDTVFSEYGVNTIEGDGWKQGTIEYMSEEQIDDFVQGRKCVRTETHLYVYASDGTETLYERPDETEVEDPDEELLSTLRDALFQELGHDFQSVADETELTDDIKANLRELGYLN